MASCLSTNGVYDWRNEKASFIDQQTYDFMTPHYTAPAPAEVSELLKTLPATRQQLNDAAQAATRG